MPGEASPEIIQIFDSYYCIHIREDFEKFIRQELITERAGVLRSHLLNCEDCLLALTILIGEKVDSQELPLQDWPVEFSFLVKEDFYQKAPAIKPKAKTGEDTQNFIDLADRLREPIFIHDGRRVLYINAAGVELLGAKSIEEVTSKTVSELALPDRLNSGWTSIELSWEEDRQNKLNLQSLVRLDGDPIEIVGEATIVFYQERAATMIVVKSWPESRQHRNSFPNTGEKIFAHIQNAPIGIICFDSTGLIQMWSASAERIVGWTFTEVVERYVDILGFFRAYGSTAILEAIGRLQNGEELWNETIGRHYTRSGKVSICKWYNSVQWDEKGRAISILSFVQDITKREEEIKKLRSREKRYRGLFMNAQDAISIIRPDGIIEDVNPAAAHMLSYSREEMIGEHFEKFLTLTSVCLINTRMQQLSCGEKVPSRHELQLIHREGDILDVDMTTSRIFENGEFVEYQNIYRDITKEKRIEKRHQELLPQARDKIESYERLVNRTSLQDLGIAIVDRETKLILDANSAFRWAIGYSVSASRKKDLLWIEKEEEQITPVKLLKPDDEKNSPLLAIVEDNLGGKSNWDLRAKDEIQNNTHESNPNGFLLPEIGNISDNRTALELVKLQLQSTYDDKKEKLKLLFSLRDLISKRQASKDTYLLPEIDRLICSTKE